MFDCLLACYPTHHHHHQCSARLFIDHLHTLEPLVRYPLIYHPPYCIGVCLRGGLLFDIYTIGGGARVSKLSRWRVYHLSLSIARARSNDLYPATDPSSSRLSLDHRPHCLLCDTRYKSRRIRPIAHDAKQASLQEQEEEGSRGIERLDLLERRCIVDTIQWHRRRSEFTTELACYTTQGSIAR